MLVGRRRRLCPAPTAVDLRRRGPDAVADLRVRHRGVQIKWRPDVVAGRGVASSCIASAADAYPGGRTGVDPSFESPGLSLIRPSLVRTPLYRYRLQASNSRDEFCQVRRCVAARRQSLECSARRRVYSTSRDHRRLLVPHIMFRTIRHR